MNSKNISFPSKDDWISRSVKDMMKPVDKCKSDETKRISAGADNRQKKKHRKLKYNYKDSKNRKYEKWKKLKDGEMSEDKPNLEGSDNKGDPMKSKKRKSELPKTNNQSGEFLHESKTKQSKSESTGDGLVESEVRQQAQKYHDKRNRRKDIQEDSSDSSTKIVKRISEKLDPRTDMGRKTEIESEAKPSVKSFKRNSMDDSREAKKIKKKRTKNEKPVEKLVKIADVLEENLAKTLGKNKAKRGSLEQKDVKKSGTNSESASGSEKKERKKMMKKVSRKMDGEFKSGKLSGKIMVRNLAPEEKDRSMSDKESESVSESEKKTAKEEAKSVGKTRNLSDDLNESQKFRDKKKAKKHKNTYKSTSEKYKIKKSEENKIKSHHIYKGEKSFINEKEGEEEAVEGEEGKRKKSKSSDKISFGKKMKRVDGILTSGSEETKPQRKLSSGKKPRKKLPEDREREDKPLEDIRETKRSPTTSTALSGSSFTSSASLFTPVTDISTSAVSSPVKSNISITEKSLATAASITEKEKSENDMEQTDHKAALISEEKNEERIAVIAKPVEKKMVRTKMNVKPKMYNMKIKEDLISTAASETCGDNRRIMRVSIQKKGKVHDMTTTPKRIRYGTIETEQTRSDTTQGPESESTEEREMTLIPNKIKQKEVVNESNSSNEVSPSISTSTSCSIQDADSSADTEQNEPNEPQDRSYTDGLAQIRTILEIYGTEEEKTEAFNKLLDEEVSMSEKEIAGNLRKAVCDLPMNTELLEKVLMKMRRSGLLRKEEHEALQQNLVPQAVNESVTIALLAQVLQRQKVKK